MYGAQSFVAIIAIGLIQTVIYYTECTEYIVINDSFSGTVQSSKRDHIRTLQYMTFPAHVTQV